MKRYLEITQDDIDWAETFREEYFERFENEKSCPAGMAAQRVFGANFVAVSNNQVCLRESNKYIWSRCSPELARFTKRFDNGRKVKPAKIRIEF